jgi:glycosyltransferase involved in cell wall biosynthesis
MKLNWFSPLPPAKSEIANYAARLLPVLAAHAEIVLWTEDGTALDSEIEKHAEVRRYPPFDWAALNKADINVYHIGNSAMFHRSIWEASRRYPGIVVLHDVRLHHLFIEIFWDQCDDPARYFEAMKHYDGESGRVEAEDFFMGKSHDINYMAKHYPLTPLAIDGSLGVLTHAPHVFDELKPVVRQPIAYAPLPFAADNILVPQRSEVLSPEAANEKADARYRLIVFGHIGDNRRLDSLIDGLAGLSERDRFRLDVYGRISDETYYQAKIYALGIDHLVALHGFVSEEELDAALSSAHLAINLRYPSMGEASASQLRIWSYSLPSLVTKVDWYARLPPDTVAFVRPEYEIEDIQLHLNAFLRDPASFAKMGEKGRQTLLHDHTPKFYVETLIELADAAGRYRPRAALDRLAERVGEGLRDLTDSAQFDKTIGKIAEKIESL